MNRFSSPVPRRGLLAAALLVSVLLGGCATTGGASPDQAVGKRAQERWNLLLKSDYGNAYEYLSPAQRAVASRQSYINRFGEGAQWLSAKLQSVSCESNERCSAVLEIQTQVVARGFSAPITNKVTEIWVKDEGNWWFHQNP
jgi:hypothetical protein